MGAKSPAIKTWRTDDDGNMQHDGDCYVFDRGICTCGLIHFLRPRRDKEERRPEFWKECAKNDALLDAIRLAGWAKLELIERPVDPEKLDKLLTNLGFDTDKGEVAR